MQASEKTNHFHADALRKGRCSEKFGLYLITKCVKKPAILTPSQRSDAVEALLFSRQAGDVLLHAFVVMPDHWHCLLSLAGEKTLGKTVEVIGRRARYLARQRAETIGWVSGFHDRKIRAGESVTDIVRYIENNPVRKTLVGNASEWLWSSANPQYQHRLDRSFLDHERWSDRR
ncbi:MAG: transposase [bacterium]